MTIGLSRAEAAAFERIVPLFAMGRAPSLDEMCWTANLAHRTTAQRYVRRWAAAGLLTYDPGVRRSYKLVRMHDRLREFSDEALLAEVERRGLTL